jgi:hypothetical protein
MLEQSQADYFIKLKKHRTTELTYDMRSSKLQIPLIGYGTQTKEEFILDINKNTIKIEKYTVQNRMRKSIGLIRVDFGAGAHTNPDGKIITGPHIHIYKEGYDLKWAYNLPYVGAHGSFTDNGSAFANLNQFYMFCNISDPPILQGGLL